MKNRLTWRCRAPKGYVDLRYAHVHRLSDDHGSWPGDDQQGMCYLTGLVYEELFGDYRREKHLQARLAWLRRQPAYTSQPYEQLARFYRNSGHLRHASDVGFAREEQRLRKLREDDSKERRSRKDRWKTRWSLLRQAEYWTVEAEEPPWRVLRWWLGVSSILGWVLVTVTASTVLAARR